MIGNIAYASDCVSQCCFSDHFRSGLPRLWQAYRYAKDAGASPWDFALEIDTLFEAGLTVSDLRWMVAKGFVEHGQETSIYGDQHRSFLAGQGFNFMTSTCLILTPNGAALAEFVMKELTTATNSTLSIDGTSPENNGRGASHNDRPTINNSAGNNSSVVTNNAGGPLQSVQKPRWDATRRELSLAGVTVKHFRVPARNQEIILTVFEEECWPEHIDDPLPFSNDVDSHTRLHDTINRLNRCQSTPLLNFRSNGTGSGVFWKHRRVNR